jgi:glutathione S-transferase
MRLFDNAASPYAFKVRATLYEKRLEFERREIRHQREREELLRLNPRGEVPALQDGETVLYDSKVICEYLEDKYPTPALMPPDPAGRARCRALEIVCDTQIDGCVTVLAVLKLFRPEAARAFPEALPRIVEVLHDHYANLDRELGGREFLAGTLSRADLALAPHLAAAAFMGYSVTERFPRLAAWAARMNARPSVQRATGEALEAHQQSQGDAEPMFNPQRLHWRNDRIEWAIRAGLGPWLLDEIAAGRAFFSPVP